MDASPQEKARANRLGALAMLGANGLFIVNDAMIKLAAEAVPAAQTIGVRGVFATAWVLIAVLVAGFGWQLRHALERRTVGRAVLDVGSTFTYLIALFHLPIALAVAIGQTAPLMMLVLSVAFLGERVVGRRWVAVLGGFAAVLVIVRPGSEGFTWWAALSLLATLLNASRDVYTRVIPLRVPSLIITFATATAVAATGMAVTLVQGWQPMTGREWLLLAGASVFLAGAYHLTIVSMRLGELSFVGGFRYASVPAAALAGWLVWGQLPDPVSAIGMVLLIAAGLYLLQAERRAGGR